MSEPIRRMPPQFIGIFGTTGSYRPIARKGATVVYLDGVRGVTAGGEVWARGWWAPPPDSYLGPEETGPARWFLVPEVQLLPDEPGAFVFIPPDVKP